MGKETVLYLHNGKILSHKKEILPFVTRWMDLEKKPKLIDTENRVVFARGQVWG